MEGAQGFFAPFDSLVSDLEFITASAAGAVVGRSKKGMPGNPEECRLHALTCVRLAQTSATRQARDHFAKLARTWIRLGG